MSKQLVNKIKQDVFRQDRIRAAAYAKHQQECYEKHLKAEAELKKFLEEHMYPKWVEEGLSNTWNCREDVPKHLWKYIECIPKILRKAGFGASIENRYASATIIYIYIPERHNTIDFKERADKIKDECFTEAANGIIIFIAGTVTLVFVLSILLTHVRGL